MKVISGNFDGNKKKMAIVVSRFNESITKKLLNGAVDCLVRHGVAEKDITVAWVPGAFEIPQMASQLSETKIDGIITLGCVIKGETPHFDHVAGNATSGVAQVALESELPISLGILTTNTVEQAESRAGGKSGNKGWDAAISVLEMINAFGQVK